MKLNTRRTWFSLTCSLAAFETPVKYNIWLKIEFHTLGNEKSNLVNYMLSAKVLPQSTFSPGSTAQQSMEIELVPVTYGAAILTSRSSATNGLHRPAVHVLLLTVTFAHQLRRRASRVHGGKCAATCVVKLCDINTAETYTRYFTKHRFSC